MNLRSRSVAVSGAALVTVVGLAAPALAGSWTSTIVAGANGFSSRTWGDDNSGSTSRTSVKLTGCRMIGGDGGSLFSRVKLVMMRQRGILPDEAKGFQNFYCYNSATNSWPSQEADVYYWYIEEMATQRKVCSCTMKTATNGVYTAW